MLLLGLARRYYIRIQNPGVRIQSGNIEMNDSARSFQDLIVWKKAHIFVLRVYQVTQTFPRIEKCSLVSQFRRAAISIPANIAEGSLEECRYYIILGEDLNYLNKSELWEMSEEIGKLLYSYRAAILDSGF